MNQIGELKWADCDVINVAIKILKRDASRETRDDFRREVEIMSGFSHDNILRLLGISCSGNYNYVTSHYERDH